MEVIVLDSGLEGEGTHHLNLSLAIHSALERGGIPFRIFGHRKMEASVAKLTGALPHFFCGFYDGEPLALSYSIPRSITALIRNAVRNRGPHAAAVRGLNDFFSRDLARLPGDVWKKENLLLLPSLSCNQFFGLAKHIASLAADKRPHIACVFTFISTWTPTGAIVDNDENIFSAARKLETLLGDKLAVYAETAPLAAHYNRFFSRPVEVLPLPLPLPLATAKPGTSENSNGLFPRISFLGYSRTAKGFHLLPAAIKICQSASLRADFTVQINHTHWEPLTIETERLLREIGNIRLVEGPLDPDQYFRELASADVMLLPYDPQKYDIQGSGILAECLAFSCPIIATEKILAAVCIERGTAAGEVFSPHNAEALAQAIIDVVDNLPKHKRKAKENVQDALSRHSSDRYLSALLSRLNS
ncbi:MAG TPA: glycosyltransferase [Xanthobacteraceae bacterium]|nr:glycosyltransferase [Xanthobacteraceae bacterium]